jgi:nicotinate dehydrogenase subunit B
MPPTNFEALRREPDMALKPNLAATLESAPRIGDWLSLRVDAAGKRQWQVHTGKVELGQAIHTALRQIAASALGEDVERVQVAPVATATSPDEGTTSGSRSVEDGGALLTAACRSLLQVLRARTGITDAAGSELLAHARPQDFTQAVDPALAGTVFSGDCIGNDVRNAQTLRKLAGEASFVHDMRLAGMLHARVLRGPGTAVCR